MKTNKNSKKKINQKEIAGITLIALVITIIVLLILAGISISMLSGDNSILNQAGRARNITGQKDVEERIQLAYLASVSTGLGDVTKDKFEVELKKEFGEDKVTDLADDLSTVKIDGKEYETGVSGGGGDTTPTTIAEAKTASGGTVTALSNDDTTLLKDDLENEVKVPKGFGIATDSGTKVEEGIVIEDVSHTDTKGSQFVWVPVGEITKTGGTKATITLGRYKFNSPSNGTETPVQAQTGTTYTATTSASVISSYYYEFKDAAESQAIKSATYGNTKAKSISDFVESAISNKGYYIARYEAGVKGTTASSADETYTISGSTFTKNSTTANSIVTTTGVGVWNCIKQSNAAAVCQSMYNTTNDKVTSDLINSYAWDTAIVFIEKCGTNGNYANKKDGNGTLKTTGNNSDEQCKINDMAGNIMEWTTETSSLTSSPCVSRGGGYSSTYGYAVNRYSNDATRASIGIGFRPLLYL